MGAGKIIAFLIIDKLLHEAHCGADSQHLQKGKVVNIS